MKLLITGAFGFLGQYVLTEALRLGHQVRAVVRSANSMASLLDRQNSTDNLVKVFQIDLSDQEQLASAMEDIDAVIHLASAKVGSFDIHYRDTVLATESLLAAMANARVLRLVAISSFSVFDYLGTSPGSLIDEASPIDPAPERRDNYARAKLLQEAVVRRFEKQFKGKVTIIRPGIIYGPYHLWTSRLGINLKDKLWVRIGQNASLPLSYVENCAEAIVQAAITEKAVSETLNIVDDDLPTQQDYFDQLTKLGQSPPFTIKLDWSMMQATTQILDQANQLIFREQLKLPEVLIPSRLHARFKPLRYSNSKAKQLLNWSPRYSLQEALQRSTAYTAAPTLLNPSTIYSDLS